MLYDFAIKRVLSIAFLSAWVALVFATSTAMEHFGVEDGLSHYSINAFYQDEYGRMWVATRDGLNCIAGNDCRIFRGDETENPLIRNNYIHTVCGDRHGNLLFRSGSSVLRLDLRTETLSVIDSAGVQAVVYGRGRFLIAARDTLFAYNGTTLSPLFFIPRPMAIYESAEQIIVSNREGVSLYNTTGRLLQHIAIPSVVQIFRDSRQNLWLCSRTDGLYCLRPTGDRQHIIAGTDVRTIAEDHQGNYWVGTYSGLICINAADMRPLPFAQGTPDDYPFSVRAITCDEQGTLWIGSFFGAIDLYNPRHAIYTYYGAGKEQAHPLSYPIVNSIISDSLGTVYIATNGGGLNVLYPNGTIVPVRIDRATPQPAIKSLWLDEPHHLLYMGTHQGGLITMDTRTKRLRTYTAEQGCLPDNRVRELVEYGDTLFFSTERGIGLMRRSTGEFSVLDSVSISGELAHLRRQNSVLWFARQHLTYAYHIPTRRLSTYTIPKPVHVFGCDIAGNLLAGTIDGILRFDTATGVWQPFAELNACLDSRSVIDLLTTPEYYIIATSVGLTIVSADFTSVRYLTAKTGFPLEILTEQSLYADSQGTVWVGGIDGMCRFCLKDVMTPGEPVHIFPVGITIRNTGGNVRRITQGLPVLDTLYLQPDEKVLTIRFGSSSYSNILRPQLYYRLEGFDTNRQPATAAQSATYTNLAPGEYDFLLQDNIGDTYRLHIIVEPHWYETWWAKTLFITLIACAVLATGGYILQRALRKTKARIAEQEAQLAKKNEQLRLMRERLQNERFLFATQVQNIIEAHLDDADFDINKLAQEMCMSRTGLYTKLQDATGKTPNELIAEMRLQRAATLLKDAPEKSIAEIAYIAGYNTPSYFIRCFSKRYGITPSAYRKNL